MKGIVDYAINNLKSWCMDPYVNFVLLFSQVVLEAEVDCNDSLVGNVLVESELKGIVESDFRSSGY